MNRILMYILFLSCLFCFPVSGKNKKFYRYVNDKELNIILETGEIPNVNAKGEPKEVYITNKRYKCADKAKSRLQLPQKPTGRIEFRSDKLDEVPVLTKIRQNQQWGKGRGKEATTKQIIKIDTSKIKVLKP